MDTTTLRSLIQDAARVHGLSTKQIAVSFQDCGEVDGGFQWSATITVQHKTNGKKFTKVFAGQDPNDPAIALEGARRAYADWCQPERAQAKRDEEAQRRVLSEMAATDPTLAASLKAKGKID